MKIGIYPGSFDPFTNGHLDIVQRARSLFDCLIIAVAVNSSKKPLFSIEERIELISRVINPLPGVKVTQFRGLLVEFAQQENATAIATETIAVNTTLFILFIGTVICLLTYLCPVRRLGCFLPLFSTNL